MAWIFYLIAAVLFFFAAVGVAFIPNPTAWGLFFVALGLTIGGGILSVVRPRAG